MENNKAYIPDINTGLWTVSQENPEVNILTYTQGSTVVTLAFDDETDSYVADQINRMYLEELYHTNFERNLLPNGLEVGQE